MADGLLETAGPAVRDEELELRVGEERGLGQPGREEDIVRDIGHVSLPLPHNSLLQP